MHPIGVPTRRLNDLQFQETTFSPDKQNLQNQNPESARCLSNVLMSPSAYKPIGDATTQIAVRIATLTGKASQVMTTPIGRGFLTLNKSRNGFVVMMLGNLCWTMVNLTAHSIAEVVQIVVIFSLGTT